MVWHSCCLFTIIYQNQAKITLNLLQISQSKATLTLEDSRSRFGISLQQQGRILERFFPIDESRNRAGGTGLGLSIVKTLIEGMGGNITLRSQLNEGSTFIICFSL